MKTTWISYLAAAATMLREPASGAEIKQIVDVLRWETEKNA